MAQHKTTIQSGINFDQVQVTRLENDHLRVTVSPETGGRITSIFHKGMGREFLWRNEHLPLRRAEPGEAYDPNFYGGIDEIIPSDMPEVIDGLDSPDHGELWTLPLETWDTGEVFGLQGKLPRWELFYAKRVSLRPDSAWIDLDYRIANHSREPRKFLWKLHAAAAIAPGDRLACPARTAVVADPQWSRWKVDKPFDWPVLDGKVIDRIPPSDGTTDFLFLYHLRAGRVAIQSPSRGMELAIQFDPRVFPYVCYFASYGGFDGHYTAVLEPCTAMPVSVNEAARLGQCSILQPGEHLTTRISIYAGALYHTE